MNSLLTLYWHYTLVSAMNLMLTLYWHYRELCGSYAVQCTIVHKASNYPYELNDGGQSAQCRPKSFSNDGLLIFRCF